MSQILLIDGNNIAARSFYAMRELRTSDGIATGAIVGFLRSLSWARNRLSMAQQDVVVFWDAGHAPLRKRLCPTYKADRKLNQPLTPEDEAAQREYRNQSEEIRTALSYMGVRQVRIKGVEADDLIAYFVYQQVRLLHRVYILSADKDFHQLCSAARIFDPKHDVLGPADIARIWGLSRAGQLLPFRAIVGDDSDKIPGVPKIAEKRALKCINEFYLDSSSDELELKPKEKKLSVLGQRVMEHVEIVNRNLKIMLLSDRLDRLGYPDTTPAEADQQWAVMPSANMIALAKFFKKFEMEQALQTMLMA